MAFRRGYRFCSTAPEILPYPFAQSLRGRQLPLEDLRFGMYLADQPLNKFEVEHIHNIIDSVLMNLGHQHSHQLSKDNMSWVDTQLQNRILEFKKVLRELDMRLNISRSDSKDELLSSGFLKVEGLQYPPKQQMHELEFIRDGQLLRCIPRQLPKPPKEENLQEQISKKLNKSSEQVAEVKKHLLSGSQKSAMKQTFLKYLEKSGNYVFNMKPNSEGKLVRQSWLARFRRRQAPPSLTINHIDVPVDFSFSRNGKELQQNSVLLRTRWLYVTNEKEAESIKRDRKRILYDVEGWMRGWFVPLRRFYHRDQHT